MVHDGDFLHRDIAPDNIIIRKDGSPVLIDFGSARGEIASHSKTVSALVKPGYSPYEQYATTSRQQGPWTDIYALGATLYHAVTGKRPPDAPSRMVNDEYVPARDAALSSYRPAFLAAIDKALQARGRRAPAIDRANGASSCWRRSPSAIGAAQSRPRARSACARAIPPAADRRPRSRNGQHRAAAARARRAWCPRRPTRRSPRASCSTSSTRLKKRRPGLAAKKAPPRPGRAGAGLQPPAVHSGLGRRSSGWIRAAARARLRACPQQARPRRRIGRASSVPCRRCSRAARRLARAACAVWRMPSRRWRSLLYRLLIGLGIAGLAVAYQDKLPHMEGRGASVVSSQATDLAPATRITGHTGRGHGACHRRPGALDRLGRRRRHAQGVERRLRRAGAHHRARRRPGRRAIAVDDRRALTGHKGGAIVLWDLERAEKLATFQHQQAPISALAFTGDADHFAVAGQAGAVALFDIRTPSAPAAAVRRPGGRRRRSPAPAGRGCWRRPARTAASGCGAPTRAASRAAWRGQGDTPSALDMAPGGRTLASGSTGGSVRLWSTSSSRPQRSFKAHEGRVTSRRVCAATTACSPSAGEDGQVKLWDLRSGRRRLASFAATPDRCTRVAFSADGRRVISAGQDGVIRVWSNLPPPPRE